MSDTPTDTVTEPTAAAETSVPETAATPEVVAEPAAAPEAASEPEAAAAPEAAATETKAEEDTTKPDTEAAESAETTKKDTEEGAAAAGSSEEKPEAAEETVEEAPAPEPIEIPEGNGEWVLVTGATGYLASHIIKQLVDSEQYRVRGTVRKIEENEKLDKLKSLLGETKYEVEFVEADLTQPDSWAEAVKGCDYVIHTASPLPSVEPTNADEVITPAKEGTLAVLKACIDAGSVKRVVLTSSLVAICSGRTLDKNACTEEMWANEEKSPSAYDKSKALAEKAAWDFIKEQVPEGNGLQMSVVNPGFIIGPPLMKQDSTSIEFLKKLMNRELPMITKISFALVDVRDVAQAHIRAMVIKQAAGHRHIVCKESVWLKDMANIMSQEFSSQGFKISTTQAPYVLAWIKSHFDPSIKRILPNVGKMYNIDTKRMREVLLIEPREVKDSLIEMGHTLINLEIVQKLEKTDKKQKKKTMRKKKEELEEGEEKKDEPEKAASTSGSAENDSVPDAAIEEVVVITKEDKTVESKPTEPEIQEEKPEEVTDEKQTAAAAGTSAEEVKAEAKDGGSSSSDSESKKKDKKEKPKKEKKEKKKGGLFSFSFKKLKKPHVEKKTEEAAEEAAADGAAAEAADGAAAEAAVAEEKPATEKAPEEPVAKEPAAQEAPAADKAPEEPAAEEPAAQEAPAAEKVPEEPAAEEPAAQEAPAAEKAPEEPAAEEPAAPEEPAAEKAPEEPAAEEPAAEDAPEEEKAAEPEEPADEKKPAEE